MSCPEAIWWPWATAGAACLPSLPLTLWRLGRLLKGLVKMGTTWEVLRKVLALVALLIVIAEDAIGSGSGEQKKAKVIADLKAQLPAVAAEIGVPGWIVSLFTSDLLLGMLIDALVASANRMGHLAPAAPGTPF